MFPDELAIAMLRHPSCAGKMASMNALSAFWLALGIDSEQQRDSFTPIGAVGLGIEQSQIELHMHAVIAGERVVLGRFVEKNVLCHVDAPTAVMVASESIVNHTRFPARRERYEAASGVA